MPLVEAKAAAKVGLGLYRQRQKTPAPEGHPFGIIKSNLQSTEKLWPPANHDWKLTSFNFVYEVLQRTFKF
jgi:hypothetical protein